MTSRVIVVSTDHVGSSMAGPGIRAVRLAQELSRTFDVTLSVPDEIDIDPGVEVRIGNPYDARGMTRLTRDFDAVVAQRLPIPTIRALAGSNTRTVYDLYAPLAIENLAFDAGQPVTRSERAFFNLNLFTQQYLLAHGDAFICASETQRDLWLGALLATGRINHTSYGDDPTLRSLIDVVPFGLEPTPPEPRPSLRGVVEGIDDSSEILLWPGGIWNWFDPETVIRAVSELRKSRPHLWLVFLGIKHPNPGVPAMEMTRRAIDLAGELGLRDRGVHFNEGWVPYADRGGFLLEADLGVSAHSASLESRFAYRTRLIDCFWASLPVVTTAGDDLSRLVARHDVGRVVGPGDQKGWEHAIASLLDDDDLRLRAREGLAKIREELLWPRVVLPLVDLLRLPSTGRSHPTVEPAYGGYILRRIDYAIASRGVAGTARRGVSILTDMAIRRGDGAG
jgi:glycosyltransferase involved in cell wall biosynthesis